jgi:hypothetical protein
VLPVIAIYLYDLREVCLSREHILDTATVEHKAVSRKLETVLFCDALPQIGQEYMRGSVVTLAHNVRRNQFRIGINRHEHPGIAKFARIVNFYVAVFLAHEAPDFGSVLNLRRFPDATGLTDLIDLKPEEGIPSRPKKRRSSPSLPPGLLNASTS